MTAAQILDRLRETAPDVAFSVATQPDHDFRWDGDGPDPAEDGFTACDVDVTAAVVSGGRLISEVSSMGGHYTRADRPDDDLGGYLPQMLRDAADGLLRQIGDHTARPGLAAASALLGDEMRRRYDEQRANA